MQDQKGWVVALATAPTTAYVLRNQEAVCAKQTPLMHKQRCDLSTDGYWILQRPAHVDIQCSVEERRKALSDWDPWFLRSMQLAKSLQCFFLTAGGANTCKRPCTLNLAGETAREATRK